MANRAKIYTVSQVNRLVKEVLENNLPSRLLVAGEVSDWKVHYQSGHCYFLLKDAEGVLACVMWASNFRTVKFAVENGLAVVAEGFIDVYVPGGKYQFYVESMQPAGVGALQLAFEQTFKRLKAEGLFDEGHKKALPRFPERVGIVTSESGAAVHDIVDSIFNRWPCVRLFLYPVPVQGPGAAEAIAAALRDVNRRNRELRLDVVIVGRGGGSLEDLWAFNEEVVARAIYDSKIPVISAVGHEVDVTIADLVADARASTPTKAGVIAVPDKREVMGEVAAMEKRLAGDVRGKLQFGGQRLATILASAVFKNPKWLILIAAQRVDELGGRLVEGVKERFVREKGAMERMRELAARIEPNRLVARRMIELNNLASNVLAAIRAVVNRGQLQLTGIANRLAAMNPRSVLRRGYSITTVKDSGAVVKRSEDVKIGSILVTELAGENLIESKVTKK